MDAENIYLASIGRRSLLVGLFGKLLLGEERASAPAGNTLATGDFLWPKPRNGVIPYNSKAGTAAKDDEMTWQAEKQKQLNALMHRPNPTDAEKERYRILAALTYEEFLVLYLDGQQPGTVTPFGVSSRIRVGHVAIVELRQDGPWVVEAMLGAGVRQLTYDAWLKGRVGDDVWHGRLRTATDKQCARVAELARRELGKPYDFWNFNLLDNRGFYCSKLAWYCVQRATGKALDGNENPQRALWFSPKQMLGSELLDLLFKPSATY